MHDPEAESTTAPAGDAVLTVRDLECRRGERLLFAPASFALAVGEIVWS